MEGLIKLSRLTIHIRKICNYFFIIKETLFLILVKKNLALENNIVGQSSFVLEQRGIYDIIVKYTYKAGNRDLL